MAYRSIFKGKNGFIDQSQVVFARRRERSANGRVEWKDAQGKTLKELQEKEAGAVVL